MKWGWLVYESADLEENRDFAAYVETQGKARGLNIQTVRTAQLSIGVDGDGALYLRKDGRDALPDFVIARHRDSFLSEQMERLKIPVFNSAKVCALCNDKRRTHQFLMGLPMVETRFVNHLYAVAPYEGAYPLVLKPAIGHGGLHVSLVRNEYEWRAAADEILPKDMLEQRVAEVAGRDLRVYVLFGEIIAGVMRTAKKGIISNFKRGGIATLHAPDAQERALVMRVVQRFAEAGAPLSFAGVDLLYDSKGPVLGEVEDVVGSRMLYQVSKLDAAALYLDGIAARL